MSALIWLSWLILTSAVLLLLWLFRPRKGLFRGPTQFGFLRCTLQCAWNLAHRHKWYDELRKYGPVVDISVLGKRILLLYEPDDVALMFDRKLCPDRDKLEGFQIAFAQGLLGMPVGENWAKHRRILAPLIGEGMMKSYKVQIDALTTKVCNMIGDRHGQPIDMVPLMGSFSFDVIGQAAFATDFGALATPDASNKFVSAATQMLREIDRMIIMPCLGSRKLLDESFKPFDAEVDRIRREFYAEQQSGSRDARNMVSQLLHAEERGELSRSAVDDEMRTIMVAGSETTGLTICWALYDLARNPHVQRELHALRNNEEQQRALVRQCILESIRLHPVATATSRELAQPVELRGVQLEPGTVLMAMFYHMNHNAEHWGKDVEEYVPERHAKPIDPHLFSPFGFGNRVCIGQRFALLEAEICVQRVMQQFSVTVDTEPTESLFLTMKPKGLRLCFNPVK